MQISSIKIAIIDYLCFNKTASVLLYRKMTVTMANEPKPNDDPSDDELIAQISKMFDEVDPVSADAGKAGTTTPRRGEPTQ